MNGVPKTTNSRSISLYGLSVVTLTFKDGSNDDADRQEVINRVPGLDLPDGVSADVSPPSAPSGLINRYVLQSPDRSPTELKALETWVVEPQCRAVPGVAVDAALGGLTMQILGLLYLAMRAAKGLSPAQGETALGANIANAG